MTFALCFDLLESFSMKKIVLCADDYGYCDEVSEGILALLDQGRLNAASCLTTSKSWVKASKSLYPYKGKAQLGLHFNLTEDQGFGDLKRVILQAMTHQLDQSKVYEVFQQQLEAFIGFMEMEPDFIDGHQHIQHLPTVRDVIIDVISTRTWNKKPWVRVSSNGLFRVKSVKEAVIHLIGASALKKMLVTHHIPFNSSFEGIYDFHKAEQFHLYMEMFLNRSLPGGLVMCHPGKEGDKHDPIARARTLEYQYLSSTQFGKALEQANVKLL